MSRTAIKVELKDETIKKWNHVGTMIIEVLKRETDNPVEGFMVLEMVREYLKKEHEIDWHVCSERESKEIDRALKALEGK